MAYKNICIDNTKGNETQECQSYHLVIVKSSENLMRELEFQIYSTGRQ